MVNSLSTIALSYCSPGKGKKAAFSSWGETLSKTGLVVIFFANPFTAAFSAVSVCAGFEVTLTVDFLKLFHKPTKWIFKKIRTFRVERESFHATSFLQVVILINDKKLTRCVKLCHEILFYFEFSFPLVPMQNTLPLKDTANWENCFLFNLILFSPTIRRPLSPCLP